MSKYLFRHYLGLFKMILTDCTTAVELSELFSVSLRTVINDIPFIKELASDYGVEIIANKIGYHTNIIDSDLYETRLLECTILYKSYSEDFNESIFSQYSIIVEMLTNPLKSINDIIEELGYSKSNLRDEIKYAKQYIKSYGIFNDRKIVNEFAYRMCLVNIHCLLFSKANEYSINHNSEDNIFDPYFFIKKAKYYRQNYNFESIYKINNYLRILQNRINQDHVLLEPHSQFDFILNSDEYKLSEEIISHIFIKQDSVRLAETYMFATILFCYRDYLTTDLILLPPKIYESVESYLSIIKDYLNNFWDISPNIERYSIAIRNELIKLNYRLFFNMENFIELPIFNNDRQRFFHPIDNSILNHILELLSGFLGFSIQPHMVKDLADLIHYLIMNTPINYQKRKILISMSNGLAAARIINGRLKNMINSDQYDYIEICELSELIYSDIHQSYDIIISDTNIRNLSSKLLFIEEDGFSLIKLSSLTSLMVKGFQLENVLPSIVKDISLSGNTISELSYEIAGHIQTITKNELTDITKVVRNNIQNTNSQSSIIYSIINMRLFGLRKIQDQILIFNLNNPLRIKKKKYNYIVIPLFEPTIQKLKFYSCLFKGFDLENIKYNSSENSSETKLDLSRSLFILYNSQIWGQDSPLITHKNTSNAK